MSRYSHSNYESGESNSPIPLDERRPVRMPLSVLGLIISSAVLAGGAWFVLRADVQQHSRQIEVIGVKQDADHDILISIKAELTSLRSEIDRKAIAGR